MNTYQRKKLFAATTIREAENTIHNPNSSASEIAGCIGILLLISIIAVLYYAGAFFMLVVIGLYAAVKFLFG